MEKFNLVVLYSLAQFARFAPGTTDYGGHLCFISSY